MAHPEISEPSSPATTTMETPSDAEKAAVRDAEIANNSATPLSTEKTEEVDKFLVKLDHDELPTSIPSMKKWWIMFVICSCAMCVTCASSMASSTFPHIEKSFGVGEEVAILSLSLFVIGLGIGPLLFGGLSEFIGRNTIYRISFISCTLLNFPVAFANNIAVHLIFRFLTGLCGSAFLSVGGGSVADLFAGPKIATAIAVYSLSPFIGPVVGPVVSGFINQYTSWRWTYYVLIIWVFVETVLLHLIPETYAPTLTDRKAARIRAQTGDDRYYSPFEKKDRTVVQTVQLSIMRPFSMMVHEPMVLFLNIWSSLELAIVYITFSVFPIIFGEVHHFTQSQVGLAFIGLGIGMASGTALQPIWNALFRKDMAKYGALGQKPPPEVMLYPAMLAAILSPLSLYMFAFTVYHQVHWIVPIIVITPFGTSVVLCFTSTFNFFIQTYRPYAASALASNSFMRGALSAGLPLAAGPMFRRMTNTGGLAFLAGVMTLLAPVPFMFYKYGHKFRTNSKYAV